MIEKAVFSYFNTDESFIGKCGFTKYSDFLFTTALSIACASRHFKEVQVISTSWGVDMFKQIGLPITEYSTSLDRMKVNSSFFEKINYAFSVWLIRKLSKKYFNINLVEYGFNLFNHKKIISVSRFFWAYGKLIAYCEQTQPFVHIDNDVFLWNPLPERILSAKLCFQSHEPFYHPGYSYYNMLKPCFYESPVKPQIIIDNPVSDYAYNCGICGGNDLNIFKEWKKISEEYIFAPENQKFFFDNYWEMLIHQNLFYEQYFIACLIKKYGLREDVEVMHENAMKINEDLDPKTPRYTHMWGTTKKDAKTMRKVRYTLFTLHRDLYNQVDSFCKRHKI